MSDYYRLDFNIQPYDTNAADLLAAFLADIGFESFEESDYGLAAFIQSGVYNEGIMKDAISTFPMEVHIKWDKTFITHQDWNEEWEKNCFKPIVLADGRCVVHSSFHRDFEKAEIEVVVDPKMAFGTGHHATTSMMINFLFEMPLIGRNVMDMGTGTGILAIVAKKLGAGATYGIEIDPSAYENALENIALNNVEVVLLQGDADMLDGISGIDVFLANINRNIILADIDRYIRTLGTGGIILLSGFYQDDVPLIEKSLNLNGMRIAEVKSDGEWAAIRAVWI